MLGKHGVPEFGEKTSSVAGTLGGGVGVGTWMISVFRAGTRATLSLLHAREDMVQETDQVLGRRC